MPRPLKRRRICAMPRCRRFGSLDPHSRGVATSSMTIDEYETIRLIDLEGLTQEQCAAQMQVARTTAQAIYNSARQKLARYLVEGGELVIEGGEYTLCGMGRRCQGHCQRRGCAPCAAEGQSIPKDKA